MITSPAYTPTLEEARPARSATAKAAAAADPAVSAYRE